MKDTVTFADFQKIDFKVGKVVEVEDVVESQNLLRMKVDLGSDYGIRTIFAGVKKWYKPSQLKGKKFIFVANLEPKKMMGSESQGMMLAADTGEPVLIPVNKKVKEGTVIR
ncbi:hypothetical protein A2773_06095 [Candidatus Gottesmanbacteria bacterium RIFCSPHIGHO2_01_FULL_39_10]|uniref:Methionine--tRNA ligase n=1 Tax=Candidatus Gottesmanbacteria bacterium RIFCSPHIGHO2_01_FULL_39_10 TaxID=1798375 RepID=A0A1F5ZM29_9BACT|nr:MAG: hypothetical protein A2773_06095 [Candidatus Gottesmanbacteria bacterium RIFCSPHIGHO2_01_FULL_39_10]